MPVQLNHTIVQATNREETAAFFADILGLPEPTPFGPFLVMECANNVSLDVMHDPRPRLPQHYAFLVSEEEFDAIFARIKGRNLPFWADPFHTTPNQVNTNDGGRGLYWEDPNGHNLEIITRPYGAADSEPAPGSATDAS